MQISASLLKRIALGVSVAAASSGCTEQDNNSTSSEKDTTVISSEVTDSSHCITPGYADSVNTTIQPADSGNTYRLTPENCPPCGMG